MNRICENCLGLGYNVDKTFNKCTKCNGLKIVSKEIPLSFNCKLKTIVYHKKSHEDNNKITGNIFINILPKILRGYKIINNYDLLYIKIVDLKDIRKGNYSFKLKHFDNETHSFNVKNIIFNREYHIENMGLYNINDNKRNNLIFLFFENNDLLNEDTFIETHII